jgi:hypothetical protein
MAYYLFRAIDAETGKRIYGAYLEDRDVIVDANGVFHKIQKYSARPYTGYKNKHGRMIFCGDVFEAFDGVTALIDNGGVRSPFPLKITLYGYITDADGKRRGHTVELPVNDSTAHFLRTMEPKGNKDEDPDWCPFYEELKKLAREIYGEKPEE